MKPTLKVFLAILLVASLTISCGTAYTQKRTPDVHFETTPQSVVEEMLQMAGVTKDDIVYDLGCGDGRFVITAAQKFGARGVGIDIDPKRVKESRENAIEAGVIGRVQIIEDDLFTTNISEATVITLYLLRDLNLKLRPKLLRELKPGTRILSYVFDMGDWEPDDKVNHIFNYWIIPAQVAGTWRWSLSTPKGERQYNLNLKQEFQKVTGQVTIPEGREIRITETKLTGDRLSFKVRFDDVNRQRVVMEFNGRASGNVMEGKVVVAGGSFSGSHSWAAQRHP